ncbi:MAG: GAF domain-containing protein [Geothrix sp.]|nr:GAF domain-containing protein [Geothrix sp.]
MVLLETRVVVAKPVKHRTGAPDPMAALADLLQETHADPARLFERGLALLVQVLGVDRALLTRVSGLGFEVFWWAMGPRITMADVFEAPEKGFCPFAIAHPDRLLTIRDSAADPRWRKSPGYLELGIRAYAGVALMVGDGALGTLSVQHHAPREFTRAELSLLRTMGYLMARTLESENLKQELRAALDALELSSAIVEDSALQGPRSGLPNRRYLEIWLRSSLFMARRRKEPMALALWSQPMVPGTKGRLAAAAGHLRGEDLLVDLSTDQYLLLMPHTTDAGAEALLARLRDSLGSHPTGATLWLPDGKDMTLKSALRRVAKAFTEANREGSDLVWSHG